MFVMPTWVPIVIGVWVILFGLFRLHLAKKLSRPEVQGAPNFRRKGLYARKPKTHVIFGMAYVLFGVYCLFMAAGHSFNPLTLLLK